MAGDLNIVANVASLLIYRTQYGRIAVKKLTITLFLAVGALSLLGCNNRHQPVEQALQPMQQSYQGYYPARIAVVWIPHCSLIAMGLLS